MSERLISYLVILYFDTLNPPLTSFTGPLICVRGPVKEANLRQSHFLLITSEMGVLWYFTVKSLFRLEAEDLSLKVFCRKNTKWHQLLLNCACIVDAIHRYLLSNHLTEILSERQTQQHGPHLFKDSQMEDSLTVVSDWSGLDQSDINVTI